MIVGEMKIALAQVNPTVGDVAGNGRKIADCIERAEAAGTELVVFGQLSLIGYPPGDLLADPKLAAASVRAVEELAGRCGNVAALVGFAQPAEEAAPRVLVNAAALLAGGKLAAVHVKTKLTACDAFDETRYFRPGAAPELLEVGGRKIGVSICENFPGPDAGQRLRQAGAEIVVSMSAAPFRVGGSPARQESFCRLARLCGRPVIFVNQVGGNDELVFDGASLAAGGDGTLLARAKAFEEDLLLVDTDAPPGRCEPVGEQTAQLAAALKLGLRDYVRKCGFQSVVLGLSGGLDSAVVAAIAADALRGDNVLAVVMPSRYTSGESLADAKALAGNLGLRLATVPIEPMHAAFERAFEAHLPPDRPGTTDENVQARIRGDLLMAFSNAAAHLPLATGNKSELATGYCTLYGDTCGALAVIGDLTKTAVCELARHLNEGGRRIPERIISRPPSAELRPDQTDQDTLGPYEVLDAILLRYLEQGRSVEEIAAEGFDADVVRRVAEMVASSEHKRRQTPPVLRVSSPPLGPWRRMPIACRRDWQ